MNKNVVIVGAGGHGKVIADIILANNDTVVGFIDDNKDAKTNTFKYLGDSSVIKDYADNYFIIAIGNNRVRKLISQNNPDIKYYTAIHPSAVISSFAEIGCGTCVMPNVTVNSCATVGKHCILNSNSVVEHDCKIADFVHLSPNVTASGTVSIGESSHIGSGASIVNNVSICENVIVGAGGVIDKDITECGTYVGVPVHKLVK